MFDRRKCNTVSGLSLLLALATSLAIVFTSTVSADSASTVYLNGDVVTMDIEGRTAEAVVIREGRIVLVGT